MKKIVIFLLIYYLFFTSYTDILAQENEKFITIVNPVRISRYTKEPDESLVAQYRVIRQNDLSATWLLTYDTLNNKDVVEVIKEMDKFQEIGLFLEITPLFAADAGVEYHDSGSWHHANSVFLSGYTQDERSILIDKIFQRFKETFGTYPKSIGGWWTDGYSLSYIKDKYGVVANLVCAEQFSTDGYKIWGQPWQVPYYPSRMHPAVPATNLNNKLDLVNIQWASRDPLNGYKSSLYSTQDYSVAENDLNIDFFKKLVNLYLNTQNSNHITIGLESDLDPAVYSGEFTKQINLVTEYKKNDVKVVTMSEFYNQYSKKNLNISPSTKIKSEDLLGSKKETVWYNGSSYRLYYTKDIEKDTTTVNDLRIYNEDLIDPYFVSSNYEFNLTINIPSIIDSIQNPEDVWTLPSGAEIITNQDNFIIKAKNIKIPKKIKNNSLLYLKSNGDELEISFNKLILDDVEGDIIEGFTSEAIHFFKQRKSILNLIMGNGWNYFNKMDYLIPQGEIYALNYLKSLPTGRVMVFDNECLQCSWHTKNKPIVFSNQRNYVKKYSDHSIVYNKSVFNAKTIKNLKSEFIKTKTKYIYLVKFEGYLEKLPFSPGDLGINKMYSNANAEIWEVK